MDRLGTNGRMRIFESHQIHALRAQRQYLAPSVRGSSDTDYLTILRALGPLRPPAHAFPGTPALLAERHRSPHEGPLVVAERVRRQGRVVKGRFQHGHVAYVALEDVPLYWAAFCLPLEPHVLSAEGRVLETLEREGPLHKTELSQSSGVRGRELSEVLNKLVRSGQVFEHQLETEWDNPWGLVASEHPDWLVGPSRFAARLEVLRRFVHAHVFTSLEEARDWSGWPLRECRELFGALQSMGVLEHAEVRGWGEHYLVCDFVEIQVLETCAAVLDPGDPLASAQRSFLKKDFPEPTLCYLLIDGEIVGSIAGRWGIRDTDVFGARFLNSSLLEQFEIALQAWRNERSVLAPFADLFMSLEREGLLTKL